MRQALVMPDERRLAMGQRGPTLAERYRPERIGEQLIQVYQWLLGRGQRPGCVVL